MTHARNARTLAIAAAMIMPLGLLSACDDAKIRGPHGTDGAAYDAAESPAGMRDTTAGHGGNPPMDDSRPQLRTPPDANTVTPPPASGGANSHNDAGGMNSGSGATGTDAGGGPAGGTGRTPNQ